MSITAEYRVAVDIPEKVWRAFRDNQQFERDRIEACEGHIESGCFFMDDPYEWAVFDTRQKAEACRHRLMDVMYKWAAKLL
jgi:hypothetical protein